MKITGRTLTYLGWPRVVEQIARHVQTPMGEHHLENLRFLATEQEVRRELARVAELQDLIAVGDSPTFAGIDDISEHLLVASKDGVLGPAELLVVGDCLQGLARLYGYLGSHQHELQANSFLRVRMHDLRALAGRIDATVDRDGRLKDSASAMLHELRTRAASLHQEVRSRLEDYLKGRQAEEVLQEKYYTVREDRYVLPVKSGRRGHLDGIVHGVSQTGQTLFIEPQFLIGMNNRLKLLQEEVRREEYAVLRELSEELAEQHGRITDSLDMAGVFDYTCARAHVAVHLKAHVPRVGTEPRFHLVQARSPLLLFQGAPVVANEISLGDSATMMVLSGPNAGGKSVALKTVGLALLMAAAGLPVPATADSYVPVLQGLHALPGDLEDVDQALSTFTGHLQALNSTLQAVGPGHLVLVDEITVGTEPDQGAALGASYLRAFADSGALAIVATHYERLKALAMGDDRFVNGAMGMDWETLAPTYRLSVGAPGSSRTFEIARRFQVPEAVVQGAQDLLQGKGGGFLEEALRNLGERERELQDAIRTEREKAAAAEQLIRRRELALEQLEKHADRVVARKVKAALADVDEAMTLVSFLVAQLQKGVPDHEDLKRKRHTLKEVQTRLRAKAEDKEAEAMARELNTGKPGTFAVGGEVLVKKFKKKATIVALDGENASLKMGPMRLRLPLADLVPLQQEGAPRKAAPAGRVKQAVPEGVERRVDLRGLNGDEALARVEKALDQAMFTAGAQLVLVHGHGTGRLKDAVRGFLRETSYPVEYRAGKREEGGDGVTIVTFQ